MQDSLQVLKSVSSEFFTKAIKLIPKQKKELKLEVEALALNTSKLTKEQSIRNANNFVNPLKELLGLKITKLTEISLAFIEKFLLHELFDGSETLKPQSSKLCIDELLQCVIECIGIAEESIQILVVRNLHSLFVSQKCAISGENLEYMVSALINIYCCKQLSLPINHYQKRTFYSLENSNSKSIAVQNITFSALKNIIRRVFDKMEHICVLSPEQQNAFQTRRCLTTNEQGDFLFHKEDATTSKHAPQPVPSTTAESARNDYCSKSLLLIVDNVVLYHEKHHKAATSEIETNGIQLQIPYNCVPPIGQEMQPAYSHTIPTSIENEINAISGKFGWCFECRRSADYFCKDYRIAVCSAKCKKSHIDRIQEILVLESYSPLRQAANQSLQDGLNIFKMLCQLSSRDSQQLTIHANPQNLKSKLVSLEMIKALVETSGMVFLTHFNELVKENLVHSILINALSTDDKIVALALQILKHVIIDFRDQLLHELQALLNSILMKILESNTSSYRHREMVLALLAYLFQTPRVILEVFVNYDCRLNYPNLAQQIIETLGRISQGKYTKTEYAQALQPQQELHLRETALQSLVLLVKHLVPFVTLSEEQIPQLASSNSLPSSSDAISSSQTLDEDGADSENPTGQLERTNSTTKQQANQGVFDSIKLKQTIRKCCVKFNYKAQEGIEMLYSEGIIDRPSSTDQSSSQIDSSDTQQSPAQMSYLQSVTQLSQFLFTHQKQLRRTSLGSYFGDGKQYNQDVFRGYLKHIPLIGMSIDDGLREIFVSIFPPGEAESLDRIIQHFSERFTEVNPSAFKNAGVTYTFAFAIMMLQTNLYNTSIKENEKMSLDSFIRLVKGINDGKDLDKSYVYEIYARVKANPLGIHDTQKTSAARHSSSATDAILKTKNFKEEQAKILAIGKSMNGENGNSNRAAPLDAFHSKFVCVTSNSYTRDFLQSIWSSLYASFSTMYETNENKRMIGLCFDGLKYSVQLLGRNHLAFEMLTLADSIIRHTSLVQSIKQPSIAALTLKNVLAVNSLLEIATTTGNWLGEAWKQVLQCLSALDAAIESHGKNGSINSANEVEKINSRILGQAVAGSKLEKIFSKTGQFQTDAIEVFVSCLSETCRFETIRSQKSQTDQSQPQRSFCLERISEVAEFNMDRVRFEWNKIWFILSPLFVEICTSSELPDQSQYPLMVVDILKQLSLKFLQKQELAHFTFQQLFLQPFLDIFRESTRDDVREFILGCAKAITSIHFNNLKSGWKVLIQLTRAGITMRQPLFTTIAAQIFEDMFRKERQLESILEHLRDITLTLLELTTTSEEVINLRSMTYIARSIDALAAASTPTSVTEGDPASILEGLWEPVLARLSIIFEDRRLSVSRKSIETLFLLIDSHGQRFSEKLWAKLFNDILVPFFIAIGQYTAERVNSDQHVVCFLKDSCSIAFDSLADIFVANYRSLSVEYLLLMLNLLQQSMHAYDETISKLAASKLKEIVVKILPDLSSEAIKHVLRFLAEMLRSTMPSELLAATEGNPVLIMSFDEAIIESKLKGLGEILSPITMDFNKIVTKIVVHLTLLATVCELITENKERLSNEQFNRMMIYRYSLLKNGFMSEMKFPNLLIQQRDSEEILLKIAFESLSRDKSDSDTLNSFLEYGFSCCREFTVHARQLSNLANQVSIAQQNLFEVEINKTHLKSHDFSLQKFRSYISAQHQQEQHKRVLNLRSILSTCFLPQLKSIPLEQISHRIEEFAGILADMSAFSFERNQHVGRCNNCLKCETCKSTQHQSFHLEVASLLKQAFAFIAKSMPKQLKATQQLKDTVEDNNIAQQQIVVQIVQITTKEEKTIEQQAESVNNIENNIQSVDGVRNLDHSDAEIQSLSQEVKPEIIEQVNSFEAQTIVADNANIVELTTDEIVTAEEDKISCEVTSKQIAAEEVSLTIPQAEIAVVKNTDDTQQEQLSISETKEVLLLPEEEEAKGCIQPSPENEKEDQVPTIVDDIIADQQHQLLPSEEEEVEVANQETVLSENTDAAEDRTAAQLVESSVINQQCESEQLASVKSNPAAEQQEESHQMTIIDSTEGEIVPSAVAVVDNGGEAIQELSPSQNDSKGDEKTADIILISEAEENQDKLKDNTEVTTIISSEDKQINEIESAKITNETVQPVAEQSNGVHHSTLNDSPTANVLEESASTAADATVINFLEDEERKESEQENQKANEQEESENSAVTTDDPVVDTKVQPTNTPAEKVQSKSNNKKKNKRR